MRTLLAPGAGDGTPIRLQRGGDCNTGPILVTARIDPAKAEGSYPKGDIDDAGFGLHLRYTLDGTDLVPRTTYEGVAELDQSNAFSVDFGPGTHVLNYPGTLELVGGVGLWTVDIQARQFPVPHLHWHWLLWRLQATGLGNTIPGLQLGVSLPTHHSLLGCYNGKATIITGTGETVLLGQVPIPVFGSVQVKSSGSDDPMLWMFSAWFG